MILTIAFLFVIMFFFLYYYFFYKLSKTRLQNIVRRVICSGLSLFKEGKCLFIIETGPWPQIKIFCLSLFYLSFSLFFFFPSVTRIYAHTLTHTGKHLWTSQVPTAEQQAQRCDKCSELKEPDWSQLNEVIQISNCRTDYSVYVCPTSSVGRCKLLKKISFDFTMAQQRTLKKVETTHKSGKCVYK